jgi:multiple antibiotic resistance protein
MPLDNRPAIDHNQPMPDILESLKDFSLVFLPLLVAMDPLAILPFLVPFLGAVQPAHRRRVVNIALITGLAVGLLFLGLGKGIFAVIGITLSDFLIAGGAVLLVVSLRELLSSAAAQVPVAPNELMAVVPIGTPLLVGPATVSMLIVLSSLYSVWLVIVAFLANVVVAWVIFAQSQRIVKFLGHGGLQAFSQVSYLLLAAIAVQLMRRGILDIVRGMGQG